MCFYEISVHPIINHQKVLLARVSYKRNPAATCMRDLFLNRDIDQMKPLSATVVLSLFTPSFRRSTASSGRTIKYLRYGFKRWRCHCKLA